MAWRIAAASDNAYGLGARADYTAIVTGARDLDSPTMKVHLLDVYQVRVPVDAVPAEIAREYGRWRPEFMGVENTLWQSSVIRALRVRGDIPFREIDRRKARNPDKKTRAGNLAFHYSEGHIWHPRPAPAYRRLWVDSTLLVGLDALEHFEAQLLAFTGEAGKDDHDDLVDAWVDVVDALTLTPAQRPTELVEHAMDWDADLPDFRGAVLLNAPGQLAERLAALAEARDEGERLKAEREEVAV